MNKYIGILSGTSLDAIDCAIFEFSAQKIILIKSLSFPIPVPFKNQILTICQTNTCTVDELGRLNTVIGMQFSRAIQALLKKSKLSSNLITAIGSHGINIRHNPSIRYPFSMQLGNPHIIAIKTKIPTIADFRQSDIANQGQGAPLAPAFHKAMFHSSTENRVILNIGGIANISILPKNAFEPCIGFDSGPGNCLMDEWIYQTKRLAFDKNGAFAAKGKPHLGLLRMLLEDKYFILPPPKSTGREYFNLNWLKKYLLQFPNLDAETIQATLLALSLQTITHAIRQHAPKKHKVFVCGGGSYNVHLMRQLEKTLKKPIYSTAELGIAPDWVEAALFAWLAKETVEGNPIDLKPITGSKHKVVLGGIFNPYKRRLFD
ncbi:MAG: anhydro-N-acetylmuramic acid kinase [Francisellaceae bacterium]|nr:anhydro-N-acetylmuramic acid kinase [Francisellaceae bacterium]